MTSHRLSSFQQQCNFDEFIRKLRATEDITETTKSALLRELAGTRHVMIVDMCQFFADAVESGQLEAGDEPFAIVTKGYPFAILNSYSEVEHVTKFCESAGISFEIHVYPSVSQRVH